MFICQYAEKIARRSPLNFSQKDLNHPTARARDRMIQELLEGRINLEWRMAYWANEVGRKHQNSGEDREKEEKGEDTQKVEKQQRRKQKIKEKSAVKEEIVLEKPKEKAKGKLEVEKRRKERINWPKANSPEWTKFDDDVTSILKQIHSSHENKAESHPSIIYAVDLDRFEEKSEVETTSSDKESVKSLGKKSRNWKKHTKMLQKKRRKLLINSSKRNLRN